MKHDAGVRLWLCRLVGTLAIVVLMMGSVACQHSYQRLTVADARRARAAGGDATLTVSTLGGRPLVTILDGETGLQWGSELSLRRTRYDLHDVEFVGYQGLIVITGIDAFNRRVRVDAAPNDMVERAVTHSDGTAEMFIYIGLGVFGLIISALAGFTM